MLRKEREIPRLTLKKIKEPVSSTTDKKLKQKYVIGSDVKKFPLRFKLLLVLSSMLFFSGLAYLLYLQVLFPQLVPFHGGGEGFTLNSANNYTSQIPWEAYSRLHLTLQTNDTIKLYFNGDYICDCTSYDLILEPGDYVLILLKSNSPVSGRFTAWQEIPLERQVLGLSVLLAGLTLAVIVYRRKHSS